MALNRFWEQRDRWPSDPPGWLFLGRAVDLIGEAQNGKWNSRSTLFANFPGAHANCGFIAEAVKAFETLRDWAEGAPHLATGTRPTKGGIVGPVHSSAWSTQSLMSRFYYCQMNPRDPFSRSFAGNGFEHVFVKRDQLEALVRLRLKNEGLEGDEAVAGLVKVTEEAAPVQAIPDKPAKPGPSIDSEKWSQFGAALALVANTVGLDKFSSRAKVYEAVAEALGKRGFDAMDEKNFRKMIDLAMAWVSADN